MLSKQRIEEVVMAHIFKPTTPQSAQTMAAELGLPEDSVKFGKVAIEITDGNRTIYVQIAATGNGVIILDEPPQ